MDSHLQRAKRVIHMAGAYLSSQYRVIDQLQVHYKARNEVVTAADRTSERIIIQKLSKLYPSHSFLSEEAGFRRRQSDCLWIIDPIDGTSNFVMGNPIFGISIALTQRQSVMLGVMYFPILKRMYWAERGKGAYLNSKKLRVSHTQSLKRATLTFSHSQKSADIRTVLKIYAKFLPRHIRLRHLGSCAFDLAQVSSGTRDANIAIGSNLWDVAAGICLVREAGGVVSDGTGKPWTFRSHTTIASNGTIHDRLVKFLPKTS